MNYVQLPRDLTQNGGHRYHQIWRDNNTAVYEQFGQSGKLIGYEVIVIKKQPSKEVWGKQYPAKELYPSSEDWGEYAWTRNDKIDALELGRDLSQRCDKGDFQRRIQVLPNDVSARRIRKSKTDSAPVGAK